MSGDSADLCRWGRKELIMLSVNDLMTAIPDAVTPQTTLRQVIEVMKSQACRQLPVLSDGKLVGIITDRDVRLVMNSPLLLHGRWQDEEILDEMTAESCMTPDPMTVSPDTSAYQAANMLSIYKFGALPVVRNGELIGIITVTDFLNYFAMQKPELIDQGD
ncbi:MAG: CBS domain-containing protein [Candidatus Promineofilum sp.]|nr:CBS domain-containing protein [Promineifilum sp.]